MAVVAGGSVAQWLRGRMSLLREVSRRLDSTLGTLVEAVIFDFHGGVVVVVVMSRS